MYFSLPYGLDVVSWEAAELKKKKKRLVFKHVFSQNYTEYLMLMYIVFRIFFFISVTFYMLIAWYFFLLHGSHGPNL